MPIRASNIHEPSHNLLHSVFFLEQICLITSAQIALLNFLSFFFAPLEHYLPSTLLHMRLSSASGALCASLALFFLESGRTERLRRAGYLLSAATAIIAVSALWFAYSNTNPSPTDHSLDPHIGRFFLAPVAFLLVGTVIFFLRTSNSLLSHITDGLTCILAFIVLLLFSEFIYGLMQIPGSSVVGPVKLPTLACLGLLTVTAVLRRAAHGDVGRGDTAGAALCAGGRPRAEPLELAELCRFGQGGVYRYTLYVSTLFGATVTR